MENRNIQPNNEEKSKAKAFWKHAGLIGIALALAVITIFVLYLNA